MTSPHPDELLAGYIDGDLSLEERVHVETHLASCTRCQEEIRLARAAQAALAGVPEVDAPSDLAASVRRTIREDAAAATAGRTGARASAGTGAKAAGSAATASAKAGDRRGAGRTGPAKRRDPTRVLAGLAVAAVIVLIGSLLVLPFIHRQGSSGSAESAAALPTTVPAAGKAGPVHLSPRALRQIPPPSVQRQEVDYDAASIPAVAAAAAGDPVGFARSEERLRAAWTAARQQPASPGSAPSASGTARAPASTTPTAGASADQQSDIQAGEAAAGASYSAATTEGGSAASATEHCVARWTKGKTIDPSKLHQLRVVNATYEGRPAILAVFLQTRTEDSPPKVLVWVLSREDCRFLRFFQRAI